MSETIVVKGRVCDFQKHGNAFGIWNSHDRLDTNGRWVHWAGAGSGGYFPTEAAAREFARKFADQPAGGEVGGCELRTRRLFLDCDGVLADFDAAFITKFGHTPRDYEDHNGAEVFWRDIKAECPTFYRDLPLMPDAMELFEAVKHLRPIILTGVPRGEWAELQKLAWAAEHFPGVPMVVCKSRDKREYALPGDVLIDDRPQYRERWEQAGGVFIHHTSAKDSLEALRGHWHPAPASELAELRAKLEQRRLERNSLVEYMNEQTAAITSYIAAEKELRAEVERLREQVRDLQAKHYEQPWTVNEAEQLRTQLTAAERERDLALRQVVAYERQQDRMSAPARDERDAALRQRNTLADQVRGLRAALTPSVETKAAYAGEFRFNIGRTDRHGNDRCESVQVPWDTIKEIMAAIAKRAALAAGGAADDRT